MQKKEDNRKESKAHNWTLVIVVLIISAVFLVISNDFSSLTGSAVRGGGSKKSDLVPYGSDIQNVYYERVGNSTILADIQVGIGVGNIGGARAKESVLEAGVQGESLEGVTTTAFVVYSIGSGQSATYYNIQEYGKSSIGIKVNPLLPGTGEGYTVLFLNLPIGSPPLDGTPLETKFTLYGIADASSVISESNENNNAISRGYIFHCAYDPVGSSYPFCCVKRVDPLSTRYTGVLYCEDLRIY